MKSQGKEAIRRFNLSAALSEIRWSGSISRTLLAQQLQLSRSTVSELVGQLGELGLVSEAVAPEMLGVGRPGYFVAPSETIGAFSVNPESDAITVGVVTLGGKVVGTARQATARPLDPLSTASIAGRLLQSVYEGLPAGFKVVGAGVAIPGQVSSDTGRIVLAPRLGWSNTDFASLLSAQLDMPIRIANNVRLMTQAEHRLGVAKGFSDFVYIYAGAGGIGGGAVVNNQVLVGNAGFAGEVGHMRISQQPDADYGGISGTLEALVRRDDFLVASGVMELSDAELDTLIRRDLNESISRLVDRQLASLGTALGNLANIFDPQLIVLGGYLRSLYATRPQALRSALSEITLPAIGDSLLILPSVDSFDSVLIGAAELLLSEVVDNPLAFPAAESSID